MTEVRPDTETTIDFLIRYRGSEPIVLSSITPDGQYPVESATFRPAEDTAALRAWLDARQGVKNLYFTVNPTMKPMSGKVKAKKEDIRGMTTLHVDLDPRKGEDLASERARAERLIANYNPPPSILIDSGGGFQGFWLLDQEYPTNGGEDAAAELEAYSQQIAIVLAADPCHNIDRIMRLPGTINVPDAKKRARGRVPAPTKLVFYDESRVYTLADFTAAPGVQVKGIRNGGGVRISGNLPKADLERLPDRVPKSTREIIIQGEDPEDLTRFPSRSEALFYVCCELVRNGVDDDTIASIILDKEFAISASVVEKPRPTEYAARQIQRAHEQVESPELRELNDEYAVVGNYGGRCRVICDAPGHPFGAEAPLSVHSFEDFRNMFSNRTVAVGKKMEQLGQWWLRHPMRRQYRTVVFAPGAELPSDVYNLWKGFAFQASPGKCCLFLKHTEENICDGNKERYEYLLNWMARVVQQPGSPGEVAVVLRGKQGTGKSKFAKVFGSLFGHHYISVSDPKHLTGSFNAHLRGCVLLFGDEAFYAGDKKHESVLKRLVTEETIIIEGKGLDAEQARNCMHIVMASNSQWVVPAGAEDRRFFVLDVGESQMQNSDFFESLDREMDSGGREALLDFLLKRDISGFNVRRYPHTEALREQKMLTLESHEELWIETLRNGVTPDADFWKPGPEYVSVMGCVEALERQRGLPFNRRGVQTKIGLFLDRFAVRGPDRKRIEQKVRREAVFRAGGYFEPAASLSFDGNELPSREAVETVRRTMIKMRSLAELRKEFSTFVDGWPATPQRWIMAEDIEADAQEVLDYT